MAAVMVLPFRGGVMYRWVFVCVCLAVVLCSPGVESAAKNEGLFKTTYLNETVDIHAPGVGDRYQDKLVLEQMKIIIESVKGTVVHYSLPMDTIHGRTIVNPSGLDASVSGSVVPSRGIVKNAIQVNGRDSYIRVTGPGHRSECFGDLDRCSLGYTLAFWVKFDHPISDGEHVYLSNGGDHHRSHGVAMLYNRGNMEFRFKKKNGQEWRAKSNNILPGRWYHVLATWGSTQGLMLYVNGELVDTTIAPVVRGSLVGNTTEFNDFLIGRPNDNAYSADRRRPISVDEFNFWSEFKTPEEVREAGPMYRYYLPMDSRPGLQMEDGNVKVAVGGNPKIVRGKMSSALEFDGRGDFVSGDDLSATCLGDLSLCQYGVLIGMWVRFDELHDSYIFSTGNKGVKLYVRDRRLVAEAQQGDNFWQTYRTVPDANRWYFIELAWNPNDGLALYADLKEVTRASTSRRSQPQSGNNHLNIGKSGQNLEGERYASMVMDDLEMWYGDRSQLIDLEFISRGRPQMQHLNLDAISHNRVTHSNLTIDAYGQPRIIDGKIGGALNLDGNSQFVSLGNQHESCLGNLDLCHHGLLLSTWIRPGQLREGMDIFSSGANGIKAWYSGGRLHVSARTLTREWTLQTDKIAGNQWQFVEFEWDPKEGLLVYVNEQLAAQSSQPTVRLTSEVTAAHPDREKFYIGRGDGSRSNARYANMTIDDVEYWYNNRKYLLAFDYIQRGKPERYHFDMDAIRDNKLVHSSLTIPVHGNPVIVPGKVNGAVRLDGNRQYLDVGDFLRACLGNMEYCNHGLAGSMWINFRSLHENAYYLSSGGGLRIYHSGGKLWVVIERSGKRWEVGVPNLKTDDWYFLEYSWHPEKGLQVFVNNKLVGEEKRSTSVTSSTPSGKVLIGSANSGDVPGGRYRYADAVIDEVETWYRDRENLIAFNYLLRDNITHIMFPLESQRGNRITHPDYTIIMYNGAVLVPGKVGNAVDLGGSGEYVDFGDQRQSCMGNLEMCPRGLTLSMDLNPRTLPNNGYILSAGPYSIYSRDGKIYAKFTYGTKTWLVETNKVRLNNWQKLEVSWDEQKGLQLYVNKEKVASTTDYTVLTAPPRVTDHIVYLGRPNEDETGGRYADAKIDELEFWYANRDLLQPDDAINHLIVDMSNITGGILVHPSRTIYIYGGRIIQGYSGNAILLNGHNQYIDVGGREVLCAGDLENCQKGFTLRFKISPNQLVDNTYFVSSAPVDVFYQNNRLVAEVRTPRFVWRTSTGNIRPNAWYQVDLSWHPVDGLVMYVNSERVDQQTTAVQNYAEYVIDKRFYLGRANTDMRYEFYADAVFDDLQVWEAKRDYLISIGVIKPDSDNLIGWTTMRPRLTTVATRRPRPPITIPSIPDYRKRLVFDGNGWIAYDFDQLPSNYLGRSDEERLVIKFQTSHPEGLLWYTGDEDNNMHLTIKDGFLYLVSTLDRGQHTDRVRIASNRLDDRAWHDVVLTRRDQQIFIEVDGKQYPAHRLSYDFSLVRPAQVYLGGSDRTSEITNYHISSNFYGKIREAILSGNRLPNSLDLKGLYLLRPGHVLVNRIGNIEEEDDEDERPSPPPAGRRPVTFITKHSHLRVPQWDAVQSGTLELNFKTAEPHGLILFNGGAAGRKDFVAVEVYDGLVFLVLNMGDGVQRFPFGTTYHKVDDDQPHYIRIERDHRNLRLTLDNDERRHSISGSDMNLDLGQVLFVGGRDHRDRLPWHVWTGDAAGDAIGEERKFFRGCVWDLKMNGGEPIDLESYVDQQTVTGTELDCRTAPIDCETNPCHNGTCTNRWDGFVCDCSKTEFTGKRCELRAPFLAFTGTDHLRINIQPTRRTHTNDISLRFRTPKEDGLLFGVSSSTSDAYLNVFLENGQIKLETNLGGKPRPVRLIVQCRYALNDYRWHTVYIRRRAHYLESWVDDCSKTTEELGGEGYGLNIDDILVGRFGENDSPKNSFVGYMQNFFFDKYRFFDYFLYGGQPADIRFGGTTNVTLIERPLPIHSVSFRDNPNAFLILPTLQIIGDTAIRLMFKTRERDGMILYNGGLGGDFFAMELVNGILHVSANDGSGARVVTSSAPPLNNNEWHIVEVIQVEPKKFNIVVDQSYVTEMFLPETRNTLDLTDRLYVGGIPESLRPRIPSIVVSKKGFVGCLASFTVNGRLYNLLTDATSSSVYVTPGCTDVTGFCAPGICRHGGICMEAVNGFFCDCNMTSFVGRLCEDEAEGYRIGEIYQPGITIYNFREAMHTNADKIALGFMTWHANGTLLRLDSTTTADFIEARLVNGHVIVMYDLGGGIRYLNETRRFFNDGNYHYLVFTRDGDDARLRIDDYPMIHHQSTDHGSVVFNGMVLAKIGGNLNERNQIIDYFNGIISSVYINGLRIVDLDVYYGDGYVRRRGDITIATHPFFVPRPPPPTSAPIVPPTHRPVEPTDPPMPPTVKPPIIIIPPITDKPATVPGGGGGGGGMGWEGENGGGGVIVHPNGGEPEVGALVDSGGVGGSEVGEGARAAAVAGAMIGVLALASSVVWAFYKFKPGLISAGGGSPGLVISSPTSTTTPLLAAAGPAGGAAGAGGGGAVGMAGGGGGAGGGSASGMAVKTVVISGGGAGGGAAVGTGTGAAGGGGGGGAGMVNLSEHFQSISSSTMATGGAGAGGAGGAGGGSGTMHRGIQTDFAAGGGAGGAGGGGAQDQTISRSTIFQQDIRNVYNVDGGYGAGQGMAQQGMGQGMGTMQGQSAGGGYAAGYGSSAQAVQQGYNTLQSSSYAYDGSQGFAQNMVDGGYMGGSPQGQALGGQGNLMSSNLYEIQNMALGYSGFSQQELFNQQRLAHQRLMAASSASGGGPVPNLMAAEEIRVDCAKLTTNGRYVVTGSIFGPPQVWDLKTGDLVRVMKGEDFSSTDLHLANGDTLLVGQVAEMEQINPTDPVAKNRLHHRKLQIWDFESGHPLDMRRNELCTASCMMNDGERMLLGRTDKYGKNTVVIIWDILGNEQLRQITCDASVGFADYISYLNLSKDNRYVIAGFQNSHDHKANFITFDLSSSSAAAVSPKVMALDAQVEVTAILENHEAVTGTKGGELIIWSIRTGRELRQLVTPPAGTMSRREVYSQPAHRGEVKDVVVSKDGQFLVSASADRSVKLWNLELEKLVHTCVGHTDEVWCCTISNDNELLVSGSRDCTIRLWRADDGHQVAAIDAGMDVFRVMLSNNKKTIVALADRAASRKLIMLKVVRTKMKGSSRATSPRWQDGSDGY